jgi:type IV secretory pathway VirB3-like protein
MELGHQLETDIVALGLTKPATHLGVPLVAFYLNGMVCFLGWMFFQAISDLGFIGILLFIVLFIAIHLVMAWLTFQDPFGLKIAGLNFTTFGKHLNHRFWNNTDSFSP